MSERFTIARLSHEGEHFEILVKPQLALSYKLGKTSSISEALATDTIFTDSNKGLKPSEEKLIAAFDTTDPLKIASIILMEISLSSR